MQMAPSQKLGITDAKPPILVSIIIRCYNQAHFLGEAIESTLQQTHPHVEVLVVDDGSTDNTAEVVAQYPWVRYVHQPHLGRCAAGNAGLRKSRGGYIVFLDADDRLLPEALAVGLAGLLEYPECAFVHGHYRLINADGLPLPGIQQPCAKRDHYLGLLQGNYIGMDATVIYRRSVFETVSGFDTALEASEDYDLYLRIARQFPIHCHCRMVAEYRRHGANTTCNSELMLKSTLMVLRSQRRQVKGQRPYAEACQAGMRFGQNFYGEQLIQEVRGRMRARPEWRPAVRGVMTLLRYYPLGVVRHLWREFYGRSPGGRKDVRLGGGACLEERRIEIGDVE